MKPQVKILLTQAKSIVERQVNSVMVTTYFEIGSKIVNHFQGGNVKAEYGKSILKDLSNELKNEFGKGFSVDNLLNMRAFICRFQNPRHCLGKLMEAQFFN